MADARFSVPPTTSSAAAHPIIAWAKRNPQGAILLTGGVLFVIMGMFPPWSSRENPAGYGFIGAPPTNGGYGLHIDVARLVVQWLVLGVVVGVAVVLTKTAHQPETRKVHAESIQNAKAEQAKVGDAGTVQQDLSSSRKPKQKAPLEDTGKESLYAIGVLVIVFGFVISGLSTASKPEERTERVLVDTPSSSSSGYGMNTNIEKELGLVMKEIPAGKFVMGSQKGEVGRFENEHQHEVQVTKPYLMAAHAVTRGQFSRFVKEAKYDAGTGWQYPDFAQTDDHPVVNVRARA